MKINESLKDYIYQLDDIMQANILAAEFFEEHFYNWEPTTDVSYLESFVGEELIRELLVDLDNLDEEDIDEEFMNTYLIPAVSKVDEKIYLDNPYLKNVKIKQSKKGKYVLGYLSYRPYELFPLDDISVDQKTYKELSKIGYFTNEVSYPYLGTSDSVWMSINPNEIKTMQKHIDQASGRVLVLGLGMGYYPYMIALKDDVKEITIIEKDENIISIFNENIFPFFVNKEKIKIFKDDAYKYLDKHKSNGEFDMVFADLWHDAIDGVSSFLRLKELEGKTNIPFMYWIDRSLYSMVRRCLLTILVEHLENDNPRYDIARDEMDKVINKLYLKVKNLTLNNMEDVHQLLSDESIDKLLKE